MDVCGFCGTGPLSDNPHTAVEEYPDPKEVARFIRPELQRPDLVHMRSIKVSLCDECAGLKRYAARSTWNHIVGSDVADRYTDEVLHEAGRLVPIVPLYSLRRGASEPVQPWSHISLLDARVALSRLEIDRMDEHRRRPHSSALPCGCCGVRTAEDWESAKLHGHPICSDCLGLTKGDYAQGKRIKSLFAAELKPQQTGINTRVTGDVLRMWCQTSDCQARPKGYEHRWQFVSPADREALRKYLVEVGYKLAPDEWKQRYARQSEPVAVSTRKTVVSAIGV